MKPPRLSVSLTSLGDPVSPLPLAIFRIVFGVLLFGDIVRYQLKGWVHYFYVAPTFFFPYPGLEWVRPLPGPAMYALFALLAVAAVCLAAGLWYRMTACFFFLGFTYVFLIDATHYLNHFYLTAILALFFTIVPADATLSLDARLFPRRRRESVPRWTLLLFRVQLLIVYVFGAIAKLGPDWLGGEPMRSWLRGAALPWPLGSLGLETLVAITSYGGIVVDGLVAPCLLVRRLRPAAAAILVVFHLFNAFFFEIGVFPWLMIGALVLFWNPPPRSEPPSASRTLPSVSVPAPQSPPAPRPFPVPLGVRAFLALHLGVQLFLPIRHYWYSDNVLWTGAGERFSWLMKIAQMESHVRFFARLPPGDLEEVDYSGLITARQRLEMAGHPEMIRQFAGYLSRVLAQPGGPPVPIHAEVIASLNGRPKQLRIDPRLDLARASRETLLAAIVPLRSRDLPSGETP